MSALVVDTSAWIDYFAGREFPLIEDALKEGRVWLPPLVAAELLSGRMTARERQRLEALLIDLPLCDTPFAHWSRVGKLRGRLRSEGLTVSTPDAHVAQCAIDLQGELMSRDGIFVRIADKESTLTLAR